MAAPIYRAAYEQLRREHAILRRQYDRLIAGHVPQIDREAHRQLRDSMIRKAVLDDGFSPSEIGRMFGLHPRAVSSIVGRRSPRREGIGLLVLAGLLEGQETAAIARRLSIPTDSVHRIRAACRRFGITLPRA